MWKPVLTIIGGVLALLAVGLVLLLRFGPVRVGDAGVLLDFMLGRGIEPPSESTAAARLKPAAGFELSIYADDVPLARTLEITDRGDLIVAQTRAGEVALLAADANGDGRHDGRTVLLRELERPHGLALRDGWLYVAETTSIGRIRFDPAAGATAGAFERIVTGLSGNGFHLTRTIRFGPDGALYLSQGSTCNVCIEADPRRAAIMRFAADGRDGRVIATGLRNSVDFDWAPWDGALYATENSRDLLGDDRPPDELNDIVADGFYGWPFVHGRDLLDPEFGAQSASAIARALAPSFEFRAHNAPLGLRFLRYETGVPGYARAALVALHGSWNRSRPDGYRVVSLHWQADGSIEARDFLDGFLSESGVLGRPAFVAQAPDGTIYVSDDYAGVIYRIVAQREPARGR